MKLNFSGVSILFLFSFILCSCRIDPLVLEDYNEEGIPCDPDIVYFEKEILPLLQSNCAQSGCHDEITAEDDVILTNYKDIIETADVEKFDANESDLFEVLIDGEMPPAPANLLSSEQIALIGDWINQGAKNNNCDDCDTTNTSFMVAIYPIIQTHCEGCHSGSTPQGGISITNYNQIEGLAANGHLLGVIDHEPSYTPMPYNLPKLGTCEINKIKTWIANGAQNN